MIEVNFDQAIQFANQAIRKRQQRIERIKKDVVSLADDDEEVSQLEYEIGVIQAIISFISKRGDAGPLTSYFLRGNSSAQLLDIIKSIYRQHSRTLDVNSEAEKLLRLMATRFGIPSYGNPIKEVMDLFADKLSDRRRLN